MHVMRRPYDEMMRHLEQEFERHGELARRLLRAAAPVDRYWEPAADVYETEGALHVKVELAGVQPSDLQVELSPDGRALVIRGQRRDSCEGEPPVRYHQLEIFTGEFQRIITLPPQFTVDRESVQAYYRDGFLLVKLPKRIAPSTTTVRVTE
jgi:HSP20 family protein